MANSVWLMLAAMAFNLAARITRSARRVILRLPTNWPWASQFQKLITAGIGPPKRS